MTVSKPTVERAEKFWRRELQNLAASVFPATPSLSTESSRSEKICREISLNLNTQQADVGSIPAILTLAWGITLSCYTGNNDTIFGLSLGPTHGHENILPFRVQISDQQTVTKLLSSTTSRVGEFQAVSNLLSPEYHLSNLGEDAIRAQQFQNVLCIQGEATSHESPMGVLNGRGLVVICSSSRSENRITVEAHFQTESISSYTVKMMLHQLASAIHEILQPQNRDSPSISLRRTSPEGLADITQHQGKAPPPRVEACVHHGIAVQRQIQPSAPAVNSWDGKLTYRELDRLSSRLASKMVSLAPIRPDDMVCILMEKSVWVAVSILAALKSGAAFLLLDPGQPQDRLRMIAQKTKTPLVLCSASYADRATSLQTVMLQVPHPDLLDPSDSIHDEFESNEVQPGNAAWAIFSSGSTGEPKLSVVEHAAAFTGWSTESLQKRLRLNASSRVFQFVSHAFGVCVFDYIGTLSRGGCLCVPSAGQLENDIAGSIRALDANWTIMTPSMARTMDPKQVPSLQTLFLAGEPLTTGDLEQWAANTQLMTMYGQSETGFPPLGCNKTESLQNHHPRDLGHIAAHAYRGWIVDCDAADRLMPPGAVGELVLEGPCLGRGYFNDPFQTSDKYIPAPAWLAKMRSTEDLKDQCLFRTGDMVRCAETGSIEYIGRTGAAEVKLRGQRMDLTEVEYHLKHQYPTCARVAAVLVVPADGDDHHHSMLAGFVMEKKASLPGDIKSDAMFVPPTTESRDEAKAALAGLAKVLPSYMVPTVIIPVLALPLTPSGKMNRPRLQECGSTLSRETLLAYLHEQQPTEIKIGATTPNEEIIWRACAESMGVSKESIGMQDSFSLLGGDSLAARQMVTLCRHAGLNITVADVFDSESLTALASSTATTPATKNDSFAPLKAKFLEHRPAILLDADIEDVFPTQGAQSREANEIVYITFILTGEVDVRRLKEACQTLVQAHTALRSILVPFGDLGRLINVVLSHSPAELLQHHTLEAADGTKADLAAWAEAWSHGDRQRTHASWEPAAGFVLAQHKDSSADHPPQSAFIMRLSHAQSDGDCMAEITSSLWAAYAQNQTSPVASPSSSSNYGDFARQAHEQLKNPAAGHFWRSLLEGTPPPKLPTRKLEQHGPPPQALHLQHRVAISSPPPPVGIPMATVAKAAWAMLMRERTEEDKATVVLTQCVNGRDGVRTQGTRPVIGACHSIIPLCVQFGSARKITVRTLLQSIQDQYIASLPYGVIDWRVLVENFTAWPADANIGFMFAYHDMPGISDTEVVAGGSPLLAQCASQFSGSLQPGEAWVTAVPVEGKGLEIEFTVFDSVMGENESREWLVRYGEIIDWMLKEPNAILDL